MAVAMAYTGSNFGLYTNLKALEKKPSSRTAPFRWFLGLDSVQKSCIIPKRRSALLTSLNIPKASPTTAVEGESSQETSTIPTPVVIIDQDSDPDATIVEITFGDRLGALLDTMKALKNLGLNVVKGNVYLDSSGKHNKFAITKASTGRKVDEPELLEAIRLTIINNLLEYHPESSAQLAMGAAFGVMPPNQTVDVDIATHINVKDDGPERSLLYVETADRPGLLVDFVKIITDINIAVESGEFDTEGLLAKAKFHVSYKGKAVSKPLQQPLLSSDHGSGALPLQRRVPVVVNRVISAAIKEPRDTRPIVTILCLCLENDLVLLRRKRPVFHPRRQLVAPPKPQDFPDLPGIDLLISDQFLAPLIQLGKKSLLVGNE
ncbi:ACT domain-containing protein ACR11-like [Forsythia ovata]|uniref:ACT domain-containing protein ACR n=1 Tax=Forsythia ovata TaxID=205694 RepID=A0ABD1PGL3_9LAMI